VIAGILCYNTYERQPNLTRAGIGEKFETRDQVTRNLIDYIELFYNSQQRHSYLGYLTPMEFEIKLVLQKAA